LKYDGKKSLLEVDESPSMRREWIEILSSYRFQTAWYRLPPCGGSGLKSSRKCSLEIIELSPSMRREWIEWYG